MTEMPRHTWLTRRKGGTYYLRAPVPTSLRASLKKTEITYSLKTKVSAEAQRLIVLEAAKVRRMFDDALAGLMQSDNKPPAPAEGSLSPLELAKWGDIHYLGAIDKDFEWRNDIWQRAQADPEGFHSGQILSHPDSEHYAAFAEEMDLTERLVWCVRHHQEKRLGKLQQSLAIGDTSAQQGAAQALLGRPIAKSDRLKLERRLMEREIGAIQDIMRGDADLYDQLLKRHTSREDVEGSDGGAPLPKAGHNKGGKKPTWDQVIGVWETAHANLGKPAPTRTEWRARTEKFAAWIGKGPADITPTDLQRWRDHRLSMGVAAVTVADGDLSIIRGIFKVAVQEGVVDSNPAENVRVVGFKRKKPKTERMRGFEDHEAATILAAATQETQPYRRWVPWLCAATGSRLSTMMNLRPQDVKLVDAIPCIEVLAEAGPIKTDEASRTVPIHPALIAQGFLQFVASRSSEPRLFYEQSLKKVGASQHNPGKTKGGHLRNWLRGVAKANHLKIGRKHRKDLTHAWRHRLKTVGRDAGVDGRVIDAITGHAPKSDGESYGEVSMKAMLAALSKIQLP